MAIDAIALNTRYIDNLALLAALVLAEVQMANTYFFFFLVKIAKNKYNGDLKYLNVKL